LHQRGDIERADRHRVLEHELGEIGPQFAGCRVPLKRVSRQRSVHDALEQRRHATVDLGDSGNGRLLHLLDGLKVGFTQK
jgi:hypothetical protein